MSSIILVLTLFLGLPALPAAGQEQMTSWMDIKDCPAKHPGAVVRVNHATARFTLERRACALPRSRRASPGSALRAIQS